MTLTVDEIRDGLQGELAEVDRERQALSARATWLRAEIRRLEGLEEILDNPLVEAAKIEAAVASYVAIYGRDTLAARAGIARDTVDKLMQGRRRHIRSDVADRLLCAADHPNPTAVLEDALAPTSLEQWIARQSNGRGECV